MKRTGWKKIRFELNKMFCPTPPPTIHRRFKHHQKTKLTKQCFWLPIIGFPHTKFTISVLKSTEIFHPNGNWTRTATVIFLNWVSTVYAITDFEHKFHKTGIENWLLMGFNLALKTITLCSTTNGKSLKALYTHPPIYWDNPGDISLPGNCASVIKRITQSSLNPQ